MKLPVLSLSTSIPFSASTSRPNPTAQHKSSQQNTQRFDMYQVLGDKPASMSAAADFVVTFTHLAMPTSSAMKQVSSSVVPTNTGTAHHDNVSSQDNLGQAAGAPPYKLMLGLSGGAVLAVACLVGARRVMKQHQKDNASIAE